VDVTSAVNKIIGFTKREIYVGGIENAVAISQ
jgi:hypothetical protein